MQGLRGRGELLPPASQVRMSPCPEQNRLPLEVATPGRAPLWWPGRQLSQDRRGHEAVTPAHCTGLSPASASRAGAATDSRAGTGRPGRTGLDLGHPVPGNRRSPVLSQPSRPEGLRPRPVTCEPVSSWVSIWGWTGEGQVLEPLWGPRPCDASDKCLIWRQNFEGQTLPSPPLEAKLKPRRTHPHPTPFLPCSQRVGHRDPQDPVTSKDRVDPHGRPQRNVC